MRPVGVSKWLTGSACIALRRRFRRVTIKEGDAALGYVLNRKAEISRRHRLHDLGFVDVNGVIIAAAGMIAEKCKVGRFNHAGAKSDRETMVDIARGKGSDGAGGPETAPRVNATLAPATA